MKLRPKQKQKQKHKIEQLLDELENMLEEMKEQDYMSYDLGKDIEDLKLMFSILRKEIIKKNRRNL
jgi:hypothetical protein